jgi:hypothetical protein
MPRPHNEDFSISWKLNMPATLAGTIEYMLLDPVTRKPKYGARNKLVISLLRQWEYENRGRSSAEILDRLGA